MEQEKPYIVYKYTCIHNGLIYIGITCQGIEKRWANGNGYRGNPKLHNTIKKYGAEGFNKEILFSNLSFKEASEKEIELIASLDSTNPLKGYNISIGGTAPMYNRKHSEESKKIFSIIRRGKNNAFYGKKHTEKAKEKNAQAHRGKKLSEEHKQKISQGCKGKLLGSKNPMYQDHRFAGENNPMYGIRGGNHPLAIRVAQYSKDGRLLKIFNSTTEAAQSVGLFNGSHITECCKGKRKTSSGFIWKYITDETNKESEKE